MVAEIVTTGKRMPRVRNVACVSGLERPVAGDPRGGKGVFFNTKRDDVLKRPLVTRHAYVLPALVSLVTHIALVAIVVTSPARVRSRDDAPNFVTRALRYLLPPLPEPGGVGERIVFATVGGIGVAPDGVRAGPKSEQPALVQTEKPGTDEREILAPVSLATEAAEEHAFTYQEVDSVAIRDPESAAPEYPADLHKRGVEGSTTVRFVVDSTGLVDLTTVAVVDATSPEFARAVKDAMPRMRFRPAMQGAKAVRQLSEQRFQFRIVVVVPPRPGARSTPQDEESTHESRPKPSNT